MENLFNLNPLKSIAIPNIGTLVPRGLIVVIGPNSCGKTQFLKDIQRRMMGIGLSQRTVVCDDIALKRPPANKEFLEILNKVGHIRLRRDDANNVSIECMIPSLGQHESNWTLTERDANAFITGPGERNIHGFFKNFGRSFLSALFLDRRLIISNKTNSFDYEQTPPSNELQALYLDKRAKQELFNETSKVFGKAIWLDPTRANLLCLRVADDVCMPSAEDRLEPEKMKRYRMVEDEGDGLKSYIGTCITLLLAQRPVCLIDEPEICLHPPQAYALGRFIGKHGASTKQVVFVATHSSHILRGIIEQTDKIEIIRLTRVESRFCATKVSYDKIKACIEKPSTKVETILDGLFSEAVTVVEGEGDRLVYSATWERINEEYSHDVHFVSVGGIGGFADTCNLYRNLKIPVCVISDLDLIGELKTFENILNSLTSTDQASEIMANVRSVLSSIKSLGPIFNEVEFRAHLKRITDEVDWADEGQLSKTRRSLCEISSGLSFTARLKNHSVDLNSAEISHNLDALLSTCRRIGLFLVPCGELENWAPTLMRDGPSKTKKQDWAAAAANRIRKSEMQEGDIWEFIRQMARFQKDEISRIGGYR